ncbi:MAG: hypothetical protein AAGA84_01950 [Pseudomonadota bacterium]
MSEDDDIPVLTQVIKRELSAAPPLTDAARKALLETIEQRTAEALESRLELALEQYAKTLTARLRKDLTTLLPTIVDDVINDWLQAQREALAKHRED